MVHKVNVLIEYLILYQWQQSMFEYREILNVEALTIRLSNWSVFGWKQETTNTFV